MTVFGHPDPPTTAPRSLRRLSHSPAVPTSYLRQSSAAEVREAECIAAVQRGYDDGYAEGLARAGAVEAAQRNEEAQRAAAALGALSRAVAAAEEAQREVRTEVQMAAPKLAFALLEALLGRELALASNPARDAVTRALALDTGVQPATVRLHPRDIDVLNEFAVSRVLNVVADQSVEPGGALVEIGKATLDGQVGPALDRVKQVLLGLGSAP